LPLINRAIANSSSGWRSCAGILIINNQASMQNGVTPENEIQILQAFNEGRDEGQRKIMKLYYKKVVFFANSLINDFQASEEIVDDSFIKLFTRPGQFPRLSSIQAFLYICTRNACLDWTKAKQKEQKRLGKGVSLSENEDAYDIPQSVIEQPFWAPIEVELIVKITEIIEELPPQCQEIFKRRYLKNQRVNEIARQLDITPQTVSNQLKIAIRKIRQEVTPIILLLIFSIIYFLKK
jgi:RNA polymerase sigma-70 factor (ECF subfamily)